MVIAIFVRLDRVRLRRKGKLRSILRRISTRVFAIRAVSLLAQQYPHTDSLDIYTGDLSAYVPMLHIADAQILCMRADR